MRLRITDGESWYKGLVLGASRRFRNNLALQASYTLGQVRGPTGHRRSEAATSTTASSRRTEHDPASNKGLSDFDIRHNFVFNYT